jgi:hypothetical protein
MLYADFEVRQQLALEHRDELAREMRRARRPRPEAAPSAKRSGLVRVRGAIGLLSRSKPLHGQLPQEV